MCLPLPDSKPFISLAIIASFIAIERLIVRVLDCRMGRDYSGMIPVARSDNSLPMLIQFVRFGKADIISSLAR